MKKIIAIIISLLIISNCGLKGGLYIEKESIKNQQS